jgi:hypothetical protein
MVKSVVKVLPGSPALPRLSAPGPGRARRFIEFFTANIRNPHTRRYARTAVEFAAGASVKTSQNWPISSPCMSRPTLKLWGSAWRRPQSNSSLPRYVCFSTSLWSGKSSPSIRRVRSARKWWTRKLRERGRRRRGHSSGRPCAMPMPRERSEW